MEKKRVLICDDFQVNRDVLREIFESAGYEVAGEACNGLEGVMMYRSLQPDLMTLDIQMPVMEGPEALGKIIGEFPDARIIMCSSDTRGSTVIGCLRSGASEFVPKPFHRERMLRAAEQVLAGVRTRLTDYELIDLRERPELKESAASWEHSKWGVPEEAYLECMDDYLSGRTPLGWFFCLCNGEIVAGLGVIENDFHSRRDLSPNICAVYTEEEHRGRGIMGRLLDMAVEDLRYKGISPVYLLTDHTGLYERYGWEYLCPVQSDGDDIMSRMYIHR